MSDVLILGGSFAGLSAALQLVRARRPVTVIDHGQPRNRFAETSHGVFGHDGKTPAALLEEARRQLERYPHFARVQAEAVSAEGAWDRFVLGLRDGRRVEGRRLIIASGVRDAMPMPGMDERWGHSVVPCPYCHGYEMADRATGVLAVGALSAHQAALLPDWGPTTYFTQGEHEPDAESASLLAARGVRIERTPMVRLHGRAPALDGVELADGRRLDIQVLYTASRTTLDPIAGRLGCALEEGPTGPFLKVDAMKQTSVRGVFAAGDAATGMFNATRAMAAGVMAGAGAHRSLIMP